MHLITSIGTRAYDAALALIYPQACAVCGASVESHHDGVCCAECWAATPFFHAADPLCWKCGMLAGAPAGAIDREHIRCGRCDEDAFTAARACGPYEGALRASIIELKRHPHLPRRLARLMNELQQREPLNTAEIIVPVPLHPHREHERGFNQSLVIARELARLSGLPIDEHSLVRHVRTQMHRAGMDAKARRKSVANAFAVRHQDLIAGKRVLLVDDVFTTGATVSACAAAICAAGAAAALVITLGRAGWR